ncbi:retrovirus-related pol polyprotein from transposon TNT 1-94 [Tanacetum coccineum]|uniref:Retrovirus-related pol polyprotein from transposon TNT 1-94 n=1 Tax=Tanacetum coccineum TaxID=301880 RepID=A0ABQ4Y587_9ASTR
MTVAGARETVGSQVVQQIGIQCFNCKGYGHYAKECRKPKRVKDYAYHKEKMMMCKQAEQGVPLQADWLEDTDEEIDEQELEAHYSYMEKIQEVSPEESSSTGQPLEQESTCFNERSSGKRFTNCFTNSAWFMASNLSHLNFATSLTLKKRGCNGLPKLKYVKDQLCSSCEMSKAKRISFKTKRSSSKGRQICFTCTGGPNAVANINGKKVYSGDCTEFLNKTLHAYFKEEGIEHQTSTPRTPEQNGVVKRRNRTLVEAARTMLSASKLPLSF